MPKKQWYKLDNMGVFYSSLANDKVPAVFRFSVTLTDEVDVTKLQLALDDTVKIFPNFNVCLKNGMFWHYLETINKKNEVTIENLPVCFGLNNSSDGCLFRVNYYGKRINFEVSHIISDGKGSLNFFKTLILNYLNYKYDIPVFDIDYDASSFDKAENSFDKYYKKGGHTSSSKAKIYRYHGKKNINNMTFIEYHLPVDKLLALAHNKGGGLTTLLISTLILSILDEMKERDIKKTIKIDIPVDLRNYFKSSTSMNFFGLTSVSYLPTGRDDSFSTIATTVNEQLNKGTARAVLQKRMNRMISLEKNAFAKFIPIILKDLILKVTNIIAARKSTSSVSNLGSIDLGPVSEKYIENFNALTSSKGIKFTAISYKNDMSIGISSSYYNNNIIKTFCRFFSENGVEGYINIYKEDPDEEM